MKSRGRRCGWALPVAVLLAVTAGASHAQDLSCGPGDQEVMRLAFEGNKAFASAVLENGIVTAPSTFLQRTIHWLGARHCLNRKEFPLDRLRLIIWYRNHGYASVTVDTIVTPLSPGQIGVRFSIHEGEPTIVDTLEITGLDSVPERAAIMKGLPAKAGRPFDKYANDTTVLLITQRLHNGGYPNAEVFPGYDTHPAAHRANVSFAVTTGTRMRLGAVTLKVDPRPGASRAVTDNAIRHVAQLNAGDLYSQADLERAKLALYQTQAFSRVTVVPEPDSVRPKGSTTVPVSLLMTEGFMHELKPSIGYGTLDCFRTSTDYTLYSLMGGATRLDMHGKLSKIGVGSPLSGLESLCPDARKDLYSKNLNYFAGATVSRPAIFKGVVPSFSLYSERRSEFDAYLRTTPVGGNVTFARPRGRLTEAFSYSVEYGRTEAQPALLCAVFNACEATDREFVQRLQRLAVASVSMSNDATDNPVNPTHGTVIRFELRTAGAHTGSDPSLHFNKILVDGAAYMQITNDVVLAARLRFGAVLGSSFGFNNSAAFIPQQERLFAGGQTSVRGFQQNELGPAVYIPTAFDTVQTDGITHSDLKDSTQIAYFRAKNTVGQRTIPTGGNALTVGMLEARFRSPVLSDVLTWALFVDAGAVWNVGKEGEGISGSTLLWTPGFGARFRTQVGVLRMDLAYNPYRRPPGAAYYDTPVASGGALFCVSPTNTLRVTSVNGVVQQAPGACPVSFQPPLQTSWFRRLTFVLTLGEAF